MPVTKASTHNIPKEKVEQMRELYKKLIDFKIYYDKLDKEGQFNHRKNMKAIKYYTKVIKSETCDVVTVMLVEGDDD